MKSFLLIIFILSFHSRIYSQFLTIEKSIILTKEFEAFFIDDFENIYLIDSDKNEVEKYSGEGKFLKRTGGFGWSEGLFDNPSAVFATPIEILIADYNNNRIQKFDKNLNYVSKFETKNPDDFQFQMESPVSLDISTMGDLYVLDKKNKRVFKITGFNNIERTFGGYSGGNIYFENPKKLKVTADQRIYVLDNNKLKVFDQFSNSIKTMDFGLETLDDFFALDNKIYLLCNNQIYKITNNNISKLNFLENIEGKIISLFQKEDKIYLLTKDNLYLMIEKN